MLRKYSFHIGLATAVAIIIGVLSFGRTAGKYEEKYEAVEKTVERHELELKEIPILKTNQEILIDGQSEIRYDIKQLLKKYD